MAGAPRQKSARHRTKPDPLAKTVGARIRRLRLEQGLSFDAFVEEVGAGRGYISELERGLVVPTIGVLDKVARALGVTMADLVLGESPRERLYEVTRGLEKAEVAGLLARAERIVKRQSE
jgi:transcriptional regulator with XRE-family HTH domain